MIVNDSTLVQKSSEKFSCIICDYKSSRKSQYERHLLTDKHKKSENGSKMVVNDSDLVPKSSTLYKCECGKLYKYDTGYYRHKKTCYIQKETKYPEITPELIIDLIKDNKDMKQIIFEQNSTISNLVKNGISNTNASANMSTNYLNNSNNNSNNKTFNLQFFLNDTCKNAMNITDFVESIKLQLIDLEKFGELGYIEGISSIITSSLKAMDETLRPVHCTDKRREIVYIKDEDKWEKDDENKTKLKKVIKKVANKNIRLLPLFKEKHPDYNNSTSKYSDQYSKIVIESMGGNEGNDQEKENKIIHNISKCIIIDKYSELCQ
jgi:hypothetical protein